jgi:hypothetical protein
MHFTDLNLIIDQTTTPMEFTAKDRRQSSSRAIERYKMISTLMKNQASKLKWKAVTVSRWKGENVDINHLIRGEEKWRINIGKGVGLGEG